jgi:YidC/Oxa1 family membrane protein insertase
MAANPNQSRFFLAIVLSLGILLIWGFLFPPPKPNKNANTETANISQQNTASTPAPAIAQQNQLDPAQVSAPDNTPNRVITVTTPF